MKLVERERVEGTIITIGRRVFERNGTCKVSRQYVARYSNASGNYAVAVNTTRTPTT